MLRLDQTTAQHASPSHKSNNAPPSITTEERGRLFNVSEQHKGDNMSIPAPCDSVRTRHVIAQRLSMVRRLNSLLEEKNSEISVCDYTIASMKDGIIKVVPTRRYSLVTVLLKVTKIAVSVSFGKHLRCTIIMSRRA